MNKQTFLNFRWRKIEVTAHGIPALVTVGAIAVLFAVALGWAPSLGCEILRTCTGAH